MDSHVDLLDGSELHDMTTPDICGLLARTKRIAVLGIKTEAQSDQPAFYVPKYMAEMNVTSQLRDQGNGVYAGEVELGSGGTFQVTVSAEQAGKTVITKRVNLTATGGN